jgi:hypothetical protein
MTTKKNIPSGIVYFPFTDSEYKAHLEGRLREPALFNRIREAARSDVRSILTQLIPLLSDHTRRGSLPFRELDGPMSRDAFLVRVDDALMHHNLIEMELPKDGSPIPTDLFAEHELAGAQLLISATFNAGWNYSDLQEFMARLVLLKAFASVLELHGQISDSISLLHRILVLFQLKRDLAKGDLWKPAKKTWPIIQRLEIVFGILHYLDRGMLPARIHLQMERHINKKNFSVLFTPLEIAKLIPAGHLPKSELLRREPQKLNRESTKLAAEQAYYAIDRNVPGPTSADTFPAYMRSKSSEKSESLRRILTHQMDFNYYHDRVGRQDSDNAACPRRGSTQEDVRHNIDLIKSRLGGIYWHLLSVLTLEDLSGQADLDEFLRGLRGLGISLDF